jgi:hypothetical protein
MIQCSDRMSLKALRERHHDQWTMPAVNAMRVEPLI